MSKQKIQIEIEIDWQAMPSAVTHVAVDSDGQVIAFAAPPDGTTKTIHTGAREGVHERITAVNWQSLIFARPEPVQRSGWINIYKDRTCSAVHKSEEHALQGRTSTLGTVDPSFIACVQVHWEEYADE